MLYAHQEYINHHFYLYITSQGQGQGQIISKYSLKINKLT